MASNPRVRTGKTPGGRVYEAWRDVGGKGAKSTSVGTSMKEGRVSDRLTKEGQYIKTTSPGKKPVKRKITSSKVGLGYKEEVVKKGPTTVRKKKK